MEGAVGGVLDDEASVLLGGAARAECLRREAEFSFAVGSGWSRAGDEDRLSRFSMQLMTCASRSSV